MQFDNQKTRNVADVVAKILAGESAQPQQLDEELKGNQHKIDANKNNKVDAHDFKLLRAQKEKEKANSMKFGKGVKEEVEELTESHFKVGDEVVCKKSGMEGEVVKVDEPQVGKYYTVKQENGKLVKYAPDELKKEDDEDEKEEMKEAAGVSKEKVEKFHKNLDTLVHSTFGKRKEEMKEETLDELKKTTLGSYVKKASKDLASRAFDHGEDEHRQYGYGDDDKEDERVDREEKKIETRQKGIARAATRLTKEEKIDEAMFPGTKEYEKKYGQSPQQKLKKVGDTEKTAQGEMKKTAKGVMHTRRFSEMLDTYKQGGLKTIAEMLVKEEPDNEQFTKEVEEVKKKASEKKTPEDEARVAKGKVDAVKVEEDVEELDELSKSTLGSYVKKASDSAAKKAAGSTSWAFRSTAAKNPRVKAAAEKYSDEDEAKKQKRLAGVTKAVNRLSKEETEIAVINADAANGVEMVDIAEREMTDAEMKKREDIVKGMKKSMQGFKQRYGDRAKSVMYATATKSAMKEEQEDHWQKGYDHVRDPIADEPYLDNARERFKELKKENPHKKGTPEHEKWHAGASTAYEEHRDMLKGN